MNAPQSHELRPKLTVITIHLNDWQGLDATFESMASARRTLGPLLEWIVVDGASVAPDPTGVRARVATSTDVFVSEPDAGIYDAMNKGARCATGAYLLFLNAGDVLLQQGVRALTRFCAAETDADVYLFDSAEGLPEEGYNTKRCRNISTLWYGMPTHHQAVLFRNRDNHVLAYDTSYRIAADFALLCQLRVEGAVFRTVHETLSAFDTSGISSRNHIVGLHEQNRIRKEILRIGILRRTAIHLLHLLSGALKRSAPVVYKSARYTRR